MILSPYGLVLLCSWAQPETAPLWALQVVNSYIEQREFAE